MRGRSKVISRFRSSQLYLHINFCPNGSNKLAVKMSNESPNWISNSNKHSHQSAKCKQRVSQGQYELPVSEALQIVGSHVESILASEKDQYVPCVSWVYR